MSKTTVEQGLEAVAWMKATPNPLYPDFVREDGELDNLKLFIYLTHKTCPEPSEVYFRELFESFGFGLDKDDNMALHICHDKEGNQVSKTLFAAHFDTVGAKDQEVSHRFVADQADGDLLILTDERTILGADDKAGVVVLLNLVHKGVPGSYYLFRGEERGRKGSTPAASSWDWRGFDRVICWDRHSEGSIITHQCATQGVSQGFVDALAASYKPHGIILQGDDGGSFTDSYSFYSKIPECTNISVGYENAHSPKEFQNFSYLERLCVASVAVEWEKLPTDRALLTGNRPRKTYSYKHYDYGMTYEKLKGKVDDGTIMLSDLSSFYNSNPVACQKLLYLVLFGANWPGIKVDGYELREGDYIREERAQLPKEVMEITDYGLRLKSTLGTTTEWVTLREFRSREYILEYSEVRDIVEAQDEEPAPAPAPKTDTEEKEKAEVN